MLNASLAAKVDDQVGEIERMGRLKRFLPSAVADTFVSSGSEGMLKSHRALESVLFCDIRGFTELCETAEPEETIGVLQTYHKEMGKLINEHGAGIAVEEDFEVETRGELSLKGIREPVEVFRLMGKV